MHRGKGDRKLESIWGGDKDGYMVSRQEDTDFMPL